jgi:hypothetical protein
MKSNAAAQTGAYPIAEPARNHAYQAYQILHWGFVVAPLLAGVDKFFMRMVDWTQYLWSPLGNLVGGAGIFMRIVGAIEIIASLLVALKPKLGAPIVALWLIGIIINLLLVQNYYDIALRDLGLCLGALALWRLAGPFEHHKISEQAS